MTEHRKVYIRKTHPMLYHFLMAFACLWIGLSINFWYRTPTFNPIPVLFPIIAFGVLGVALLIFLNVYRDLRLWRATLMVSVAWSLFWGVINSQQAFAGLASFQVPILFVFLAIGQILLLIESPVNPMTKKVEKS